MWRILYIKFRVFVLHIVCWIQAYTVYYIYIIYTHTVCDVSINTYLIWYDVNSTWYMVYIYILYMMMVHYLCSKTGTISEIYTYSIHIVFLCLCISVIIVVITILLLPLLGTAIITRFFSIYIHKQILFSPVFSKIHAHYMTHTKVHMHFYNMYKFVI